MGDVWCAHLTAWQLQDIFTDSAGVLSDDQFKKLDELIEHTTAFSAFLNKQMQENEEDEADAQEEKVGAKQKAGSKSGRRKKRPKLDVTTAVREKLFVRKVSSK